MTDMKVIVELEVPENFKTCENIKQQHEQYDCPFTYEDKDDGCLCCGFNFRDCPMKSMKKVKQ